MLHEFMSASPPKYQAKPGRSLSPERAKPATSPQPTPSLQVQPFSTAELRPMEGLVERRVGRLDTQRAPVELPVILVGLAHDPGDVRQRGLV